MQRYYKKTKTEKKTRLFSSLSPKIIIYKYAFCTKEIECATWMLQLLQFQCYICFNFLRYSDGISPYSALKQRRK